MVCCDLSGGFTHAKTDFKPLGGLPTKSVCEIQWLVFIGDAPFGHTFFDRSFLCAGNMPATFHEAFNVLLSKKSFVGRFIDNGRLGCVVVIHAALEFAGFEAITPVVGEEGLAL